MCSKVAMLRGRLAAKCGSCGSGKGKGRKKRKERKKLFFKLIRQRNRLFAFVNFAPAVGVSFLLPQVAADKVKAAAAAGMTCGCITFTNAYRG